MNINKLVKISYCVFVEIIKLELIAMIHSPSSSREFEFISNIALMSYDIIGTVLTVAFSIVELELVGNFVLFDLVARRSSSSIVIASVLNTFSLGAIVVIVPFV